MRASDFIKHLKQNPEFVKWKLQEDEKMQIKMNEVKNTELLFIKDLHENGFINIGSTSDLLKFKRIEPNLTDLMIKWIPKIKNTFNSQENLVRGLAITNHPVDGKVLIDLYENKNSSANLKWAISNTIASAKIEDIDDWLENKLKAKNQPKENEMLVYTAIKYFFL